MKREELVSIVVPVYNVEKYLEKCLNSIINQTYKNLEIICIDDGSPDRSIDILNKFAKKDNRIRIISQQNKGLSGARNSGIDNAKGKYIVFVDSDDWLELKLVEKCIKKIKKADILVFGNYNHYPDKEEKKNNFLENEKFDNGLDYFIKSYENKLRFGNCWNKFYRKDIIEKNNIYFEEGRLYEDLLFVFKYMYYSKNIKVESEALYHYVVKRKESITFKLNPNDLQDVLFTINELEKFFKEKRKEDFLERIEYKEYLYKWIYECCLSKYLKNKDIRLKEIKKVLKKLKSNKVYLDYTKEILKKSKKIKYKILSLLILSETIVILNLFLKMRKND